MILFEAMFFHCLVCWQALCDFILSSCYDKLTFAALQTMLTLSRSVAADLIHCDKGKLNSVI